MVPKLLGHQDPNAYLPAASQTTGWEIWDKRNGDVTDQQNRSLSALSQDKQEHANLGHFN